VNEEIVQRVMVGVEQPAVVRMTCRPGTVKKSVPVELPRPRDISSMTFIALQKELTALVMEEQRRCHDEELHAAECSQVSERLHSLTPVLSLSRMSPMKSSSDQPAAIPRSHIFLRCPVR